MVLGAKLSALQLHSREGFRFGTVHSRETRNSQRN